MLAMRTGTTEASMAKSNPNPEVKGKPKVSLYEQCREERIKENLQRMQNLGILNLARKLKSETRPVKRPYGNSNPGQKSTPPTQPSRRSSRLENTTPVVYTDGVYKKGNKSKRECVMIGEGSRLEVYTEEHEKLLGNTERSWTLFVDGYDKDGKRIYDPVNGKTCHQCRQKTLGHRTQCSECDMVQGQFCGDCLFMRYGEHVLEALENPNWTCPVCRGICNCSLCRNHKGWVPTGPVYRRIAKLGYKSVAHYLIQTKRAETADEDDDDATPNQASAKRSLSFQEAKPLPQIAADDDLSEQVPKVQNMEMKNGDSLMKEEDENTKEAPNSAKRSLSFFLPSVDDHQTLFVDDHQTLFVDDHGNGYLEPPKQDKQEHSCAHIGDDPVQETTVQNSDLVTRPDSILLPGENQSLEDDQTPWVDVQVLSDLELTKQDKQEHDDLPIVQERTEHISNGYFLNGESQTLLGVDVQVLSDETETSGNSGNTQETKSKRKASLEPIDSGSTQEKRSKRKASLEPNPDSIGARLRQRRRILPSGL